MKLVQLLDADDMGPDGKLTCAAPYDKPYNHVIKGDARDFGNLVTKANLAEIAKYADGIEPCKPFIASFAGAGARPITTLVGGGRARGGPVGVGTAVGLDASKGGGRWWLPPLLVLGLIKTTGEGRSGIFVRRWR